MNKNLLRVTFLNKMTSWAFTDIDKAVDFVKEVFNKHGYMDYRVDFLTQEEISQFHHDYQFAILYRIDCNIDDYDEALGVVRKIDFEKLIDEH